jgi:C-terminal processing protease CtpA/Prc
MNYYKVTMSHKGKRTQEIVKAKSKISAIRTAKQEFAGYNIIKAEETTPNIGDKLGDILGGVKKSMEGKIDIGHKISSIRQIAVMTDAGISIHDSIDEVAKSIIPIKSVRSRMLEDGYAYIRITNFQSKTSGDLHAALKKLSSGKALKGLVLDLRNNPGGLLEQAVKVSDAFLEKGLIVYTDGRLKEQQMKFEAHKSGNQA